MQFVFRADAPGLPDEGPPNGHWVDGLPDQGAGLEGAP
jgi:hypothetical protein